MKNVLITLGIVLGIFIFAGCIILGIRNSLINKEETITQQYSEIDNQLQRRYDLIPNLVATVKGYAKHETEVFKHIADARAAMLSAKGVNAKLEANDNISNTLSRLMVIAESYPDLKANQNYIRLMDELAGTENRIAVARKRYNDSVKEFNTAIKQFPGCMFGFEKKEYLSVPDKGKIEHAPKVEF